MKKTLYSLMLNDDVVKEIDLLAHRQGVSRSSLINEILADYVQVLTPERWINDVFQSVEQLLATSRDLVPFFAPNAMSMSMKSSLSYKYRPTVKYEVELHRSGSAGYGTLAVIFRTQSAELIRAMAQFFQKWKQTEDAWFLARGEEPRRYELYDGKFTRSILLPQEMGNNDDVAQAIADYVQTFDRLMKACLAEEMTDAQLEWEYARSMERQAMIL